MKNNGGDILELLTDEDIKLIISETKTEMMLAPFKQNSKKYAKYISRLGRMDGKSKMVKANLPGIVYELYNKGDLNMRLLLSTRAQQFKEVIADILEEQVDKDLSLEKFATLEASNCVDFLLSIEGESDYKISLDLLFLQLKLNDIEINDEKKEEVKRLWEEQKKLKAAEQKRREELESVVKEVEDTYRNEIKSLKREYDNKLIITEKKLHSLESELDKKKQYIDELTAIIAAQKAEDIRKEDIISAQATTIEELNRQINQKQEELESVRVALEELNKKISSQRDEFEALWQKEIETDNEILTWTKNKLINEKEAVHNQLDILLEEKCKAEDELKRLDEEISLAREQLNGLQYTISAEKENITYSAPGANTTVQSTGLRLYVEQVTNEIQKEKCEKYSQYLMVVENNLDIAGCKLSSGKIEDFFNAAVDTGLVPTLCGFGARKAAMALIAARYGEIPTIISVPSGYNDVVALSREIDEAESEVVVIEDLFGRNLCSV